MALARELGVHWTGGSDQTPPQEMDAAILFAPAGELVPTLVTGVTADGLAGACTWTWRPGGNRHPLNRLMVALHERHWRRRMRR